jgi:hypothetical protein
MGMKIKNTWYSNKDIKSVLKRKGYEYFSKDKEGNWIAYKGDRNVGAYNMMQLFEQIVKKRLNQTKQEFLDSL